MPKPRVYIHRPTEVLAYRLERPETEHRPDGTTITHTDGYRILSGVRDKDYYVSEAVFELSYIEKPE